MQPIPLPKNLKEKYNSDLVEITENVVIRGIVTRLRPNRQHLQEDLHPDETGAISIGIDGKELYRTYKPGQEVFVECKGCTLASTVEFSVGQSTAVKLAV